LACITNMLQLHYLDIDNNRHHIMIIIIRILIITLYLMRVTQLGTLIFSETLRLHNREYDITLRFKCTNIQRVFK
jgi:hypothetical protein